MKISIIMPVHNRAHIVGDALESVAAQTWNDWELLVVDDGSRDGTWEEVRHFRDTRVHCFCHERNLGISAARNTALHAARGELISFLDSDDLWKPAKLERHVRFLDMHPEAAAVFNNVEDEAGVPRFPSPIREDQQFQQMLAERNFPDETIFTQREMHLCLLHELPIMTSALTVRPEAMRATGVFRNDLPAAEDWEYFVQLSRAFRFGYIAEPLTTIRQQADAAHVKFEVASRSASLDLFKREMDSAVNSGDREMAAAAKLGCLDASKCLGWAHLLAGRKTKAAKAFLRGYRATGEASLLARAVFAYFPRNLRAPLKRAIGRQEN